MALSFQQLSTPVTEDQALDMMVTRLTELGFAGTSWQPGSVQLTLLRGVANLYANITTLIQGLLYAGVNDTATGDFLTRHSASTYQNTRIPAVAAIYNVKHTVASGSGPYTVTAGQLVASNGTRTYRNTAGGTLSSAAPVTLPYAAEVAGLSGTTGDNTITTLITTLAGVTITNAAPSLVTPGNDAESDANLRTRNATKWGTLSVDGPTSAYMNVIITALPNFRVAVDDSNPRGPGTVDIYIASPTGLASGGDVTAAQTAINARRAITANVIVYASTAQTIDVAGTAYIPQALKGTSTDAAIATAVAAYINSLPLGGIKLNPTTRVVPIDGIMSAAKSVAGVVNVDLTSPLSDTPITQFKVATLGSNGITSVGI